MGEGVRLGPFVYTTVETGNEEPQPPCLMNSLRTLQDSPDPTGTSLDGKGLTTENVPQMYTVD